MPGVSLLRLDGKRAFRFSQTVLINIVRLYRFCSRGSFGPWTSISTPVCRGRLRSATVTLILQECLQSSGSINILASPNTFEVKSYVK